MIDNIGDLSGKMSLKSVIEKVITSLGGNGVKVIDNANPPPFKDAQDIQAPEPGDNAFDFLESLARQKQVLLTSDSDASVIIEAPPGDDSGGVLQNILNDPNNNILNADAVYDDTEQFGVYKFRSSLNPIALNKTNKTQISTIVSQKGAVINTGVRIGRQFVAIPDSTFGDDDNNSRAIWEANIRKARSRTYVCTVQGFRAGPGLDIWRPNRLVKIIDEFADINTIMLINSVGFTLDARGGSLTTLTLVDKNAYTLELQDPDIQELGNALF
jgi:prophage tail gpP-like protein